MDTGKWKFIHPSSQEGPFSQTPFFELLVIYGGKPKTELVRLGEGEGKNTNVVNFSQFLSRGEELGTESEEQMWDV
jgi:hypothetical protein